MTNSLGKYKKCKHGAPDGLCTKCNYQNTGRRKSTDQFVEADVVDFMSVSYNKKLKEATECEYACNMLINSL